jgi:hypothetical protein
VARSARARVDVAARVVTGEGVKASLGVALDVEVGFCVMTTVVALGVKVGFGVAVCRVGVAVKAKVGAVTGAVGTAATTVVGVTVLPHPTTNPAINPRPISNHRLRNIFDSGSACARAGHRDRVNQFVDDGARIDIFQACRRTNDESMR